MRGVAQTRRRIRLLLASSSLGALLVGGGGVPAAFACYTRPFAGGHTNTGATPCIIYYHAGTARYDSASHRMAGTGGPHPGFPAHPDFTAY